MPFPPGFSQPKEQKRQHKHGYEPESMTTVARKINTTRRVSGSAAAYLYPRQKKAYQDNQGCCRCGSSPIHTSHKVTVSGELLIPRVIRMKSKHQITFSASEAHTTVERLNDVKPNHRWSEQPASATRFFISLFKAVL